jgi:hypothetical protein
MVALWPATRTEPVRSTPVLGATAMLMVAVPLPVTGGASESQLTSVLAAHAHSLSVVTVTTAAPPLAMTR